MNIEDINVGDTVSFETLLGERFVDFKFQGTIPWDIASKLGLDVEAKHRQYALAMLPGAPTDFRTYSYLLFKSPTGTTLIMGAPWLKENTIDLKDATARQMMIPRASEAQLSALRSFANSIGLIGFEIKEN